MVKNVMSKDKWKEVEKLYIRDGKQFYILRVNPQEKDSMITSIEDVYDHKPTEEDKTNLYGAWLAMEKANKMREIVAYDISDNVNVFEIAGRRTWLDKATRVGLKNSLAAEQEAGRENTTLYLQDGMEIILPITKAVEMLNELELYAIGCYRQTEAHKATVAAMNVIEEVESYDYTTGYPEHPVFEMND